MATRVPVSTMLISSCIAIVPKCISELHQRQRSSSADIPAGSSLSGQLVRFGHVE